MLDKSYFKEAKDLYYNEIIECLDFWLKNGVDTKYGGYLTCLGVWRVVWVFAPRWVGFKRPEGESFQGTLPHTPGLDSVLFNTGRAMWVSVIK